MKVPFSLPQKRVTVNVQQRGEKGEQQKPKTHSSVQELPVMK